MTAQTPSLSARLFGIALCIGLIGAGSPGAATPEDTAAICDQMAGLASQRTGVPLSVLKAISLTETGRKRGKAFRPWPWTVNMEGKGHWFESREAAKAYVDKEYARGARSFDIGCFQINYKWHGEAFASIDEMFDPVPNALYAARLLGQLHAELGSWGKAAGAYHSRTTELAERYQARFERLRGPLLAGDGGAIPDIPDIVLAANGGAEAPQPKRANLFPLLQPGTTLAPGSLVPIEGRTAGSLFAAPAQKTVID